MSKMREKKFSDELEKWLKGSQSKTLQSLETVFAEKSFAIIILVLMALPALPLPTGGITHIFELIVMLLSLEMILGRRTVWLPQAWRFKELGPKVKGKFVPFIIRRVRWFERFSRPRLSKMINHTFFLRFVGLIVLLFTLGAFVAPPFAGLDTLPSLGVVIIALSLILEDALIFILGCIAGATGLALIFIFGTVTIDLFRHFI